MKTNTWLLVLILIEFEIVPAKQKLCNPKHLSLQVMIIHQLFFRINIRAKKIAKKHSKNSFTQTNNNATEIKKLNKSKVIAVCKTTQTPYSPPICLHK